MLLGKISGRNVAGKNFRKKCCCEKFQEEMLLGKISGRDVAGKNFRKKCCWEKFQEEMLLGKEYNGFSDTNFDS